MTKPRRYNPDFAVDLRDAAKYYDDISKELGNRLRRSVKKQLQAISESDQAFPLIHKTVRAVRIHKFPYVVLYRAYPDFVYVVGLVHGASDRKHWFDRRE